MKTICMALLSLALLNCKAEKKNDKGGDKTKTVAQSSTPKGMIKFDGGTITIGSNRTILERPAFETTVAPFYIDKDLVSVAEFRAFVKATGYKTDADKYGDSGVFDFDAVRWNLVKGANWEFPFGVDKEKAQDNHPVTHVSWNDAKAYAAWVGKRLPYEYEWEFAAKNGEDVVYPWGNEMMMDGKHMANVWQGNKVVDKIFDDGYQFTSPIGAFPVSLSGMTDVVGNVWQWCEDDFAPYDKSVPYNVSSNVKVTRGGSFMFDEGLQNSFTTTFRAQNTIDTSLFNSGFRCAKSVE